MHVFKLVVYAYFRLIFICMCRRKCFCSITSLKAKSLLSLFFLHAKRKKQCMHAYINACIEESTFVQKSTKKLLIKCIMVYSLMCRVICNEENVVLSNTDLFVCTQHKNHCLDQWSEFGAGLSVY